jgi:hypothetical protein
MWSSFHLPGEWIARFDPQLTSKGVFYLNDNQLVDVEMMEGPKHPMSVYVDPIMEAHVSILSSSHLMFFLLVVTNGIQP